MALHRRVLWARLLFVSLPRIERIREPLTVEPILKMFLGGAANPACLVSGSRDYGRPIH
jgi:hypothetical protein